MVFEHRAEHASEWATIMSIAAKIGCTAQTLSTWVKQAKRDRGLIPGTSSEESKRIKELERENRELRLRSGRAFDIRQCCTAAKQLMLYQQHIAG